jgi:predicted protein tyrosine phosphatase
MNILFVCTSNKDRSPALEKYFRANYPWHKYRSAGVNMYFCYKKGTHLITLEDVNWSDVIVFCEDIHEVVTKRMFGLMYDHLGPTVILNLGEYKQGDVGEDYLMRAEERLRDTLN